jgi:hypothetical protein
MAALFVAASTQALSNTVPPITAPPWSFGAWVKPRSTGAGSSVIFEFSGTTDDRPVYRSGATWGCYGGNSASLFGTVTANVWHYIVHRHISTTNTRTAVLPITGTSQHGAVADGASMTYLRATLGAGQAGASPGTFATPWDGDIAEAWLTKTDVQPDGLQLGEGLLQQFAFHGPLSVPHVAGNLIFYQAFLSSLASDTSRRDEVFLNAPQTWTNVNGVTLSPHAPVCGDYVRASGRSSLLVPI